MSSAETTGGMAPAIIGGGITGGAFLATQTASLSGWSIGGGVTGGTLNGLQTLLTNPFGGSGGGTYGVAAPSGAPNANPVKPGGTNAVGLGSPPGGARPANLSLFAPERGALAEWPAKLTPEQEAAGRAAQDEINRKTEVIEALEWELFWAYTGGKVLRLGVGAFRAWRLTRAIVAARNSAVVGKTLFATVGEGVGKVVQSALKGRTSLSALTAQQRGAAAAFYRDVATRTVGREAAAASRYNIARAEFLEGARESLSPSLPEFIANGF